MNKKLYIVCGTDVAKEQNIAEMRFGRLHYIHPDKWRKNATGMNAKDAIPIERFGVSVTRDGATISGKVVGPSQVTRPSGTVREWLGSKTFVFCIPEETIRAVKETYLVTGEVDHDTRVWLKQQANKRGVKFSEYVGELLMGLAERDG